MSHSFSRKSYHVRVTINMGYVYVNVRPIDHGITQNSLLLFFYQGPASQRVAKLIASFF